MPNGDAATNVVDPRQLLIALMQRANRNAPSGGVQPQGGQPMPVPSGQPQQQQPQAQAQPQQAASQLPQARQAPYTPLPQGRGPGGVILGLINTAEQRSHEKKAALAEGYYTQINDLLATGDPKDKEKAQHFLDDPKIRKMLNEGMNWQPLTEEPPPEALGIQRANQKIQQKQTTKQKLMQMLMPRQQPQAPQGRAIIPGPSQASQQAQQLGQAKVATEQAQAGKETAQGEEAKARTAAIGPEVEAKKLAAQAEADRASAEVKKAEQAAKESEALTPFKEREYNAKIGQLNALAEEAKAHAKYFDKGGKIPGSAMNNLIKSARSDLYSAWKDAQSTRNTVHKEIQKQESGVASKVLSRMGIVGDARTGAFTADKQFDGLTQALKWWDGEGLQKIQNGEITPSQALAHAYSLAGIEAPPSSNPQDFGDTGGFVMGPDGTYQER
jgi:hypothetical protein